MKHAFGAFKRYGILLLATFLLPGLGIAEDHNPIRVGALLPLTGKMAVFGQALHNGMQMALADQSKASDAVKISFEDSQYDSSQTISAFHKLRQGGVDLIYAFGTGPGLALAPLAESFKIPTLLGNTDTSASRGRKYVARFFFPSARYSEMLLSYLKAQGYKAADFVVVETAFCTDVMREIERLAPPQGIKIKSFSVNPGDTDFRGITLVIKQSSPDVVGAFLFAGQEATFAKQLRAIGLRQPIVGLNMLEDPEEVKRSEGTLEGAVYPTVAVTKSFRERYASRFGNQVQISFAAMGYDLVLVTAAIQEKLGTEPATPERLMAVIRSLPPMVGMTGNISVSYTEGQGLGFEFPAVMRRIEGASFRDLE